MKPLAGREPEVEKLNSELVELYRRQPGCLQSVLIKAVGGSGELGRLSFWESERAADTAAQSQRSLFLRSRLHLLVRKDHQERSFHTGPAGDG
jgi:quinol monooxygenase YgiN